MFEPATDCPQLSVVVRWGWGEKANVFAEARAAVRRRCLEYLSGSFDPRIRVKSPGSRLPVMEKVICVYDDELSTCQKAVDGMNLFGFSFRTRKRQSFGEEMEFMERRLLENPGYIAICDNGLNQFLAMDDHPGQEILSTNTVTSHIAFMLRIAKKLGITMICVRHQKSDGSQVKGLPPQPSSAATGYVNTNPSMKDMQQLFFFSAAAKSKWRPWNYLEDRARAYDERRDGGRIGLYEGMTVRFGETQLVEARYSGPEWNRNARALKEEYGITFKKRFPKHHG